MIWKGMKSLRTFPCNNFSKIAAFVVFIRFHVHRGRDFTSSLSLKEIFTLVTFTFSIFRCLHLMCFLILVPSRDWNHIFHNYDTKVEKDTLINEDDAHKVFFFCTFSDLLKIFYMCPNHMNLQDGKHVDVKRLFSNKWSYLAVFSCSLDMFRICMFLHCFFPV